MIPDRPAARRPSVDRLARAVRRVSRLILWLAGSALAGGAAIWWAIVDRLGPAEGRTASLVAWAVVLLAPPAILVVLHLAVEHLIALPARLRALPVRARQHTGQVARLATEAGSRDRGLIRTTLSVIKLWRAAASARDLLQVTAPVTFLLSPAMIAASMLALVAAAAEIAVGAVACMVLVLG